MNRAEHPHCSIAPLQLRDYVYWTKNTHANPDRSLRLGFQDQGPRYFLVDERCSDAHTLLAGATKDLFARFA